MNNKNNSNNNIDMGKLMAMLSNMDKSQLEKGLKQASQILSSKDKSQIINEINKTMKK